MSSRDLFAEKIDNLENIVRFGCQSNFFSKKMRKKLKSESVCSIFTISLKAKAKFNNMISANKPMIDAFKGEITWKSSTAQPDRC
jgi:hypothetical protein